MAGAETNEPEEESDAVPVDTEPESVTGHDAAAVAEETTDKGEKETAASEHAEDISDGDAGTESAGAPSDEFEDDQGDKSSGPAKTIRAINFSRVFAFGVLPCLVFLLAGAGGYLKWQGSSIRASQTSSVEAVAAAKDGTVAVLSYQPDTVEKDLGAARDRLTGTFKDSYTQLTHDVVIPGAKQRHISVVATVPAAASVSATASHAVTLVFVNQTMVVGTDPPSATASSVRVTLDKVAGRWLISGFDPV
jgi:Mce-associated membrane protein